MKLKFSLLAMILVAGTFLTSELYAQEQQEVTQDDTVAEQVKDQGVLDEERLSDAKSDKKATKAKAREAQRVESDANDAARESKDAYRSEKKAQKSRKKADKQAQSAEEARDKSDQN
jgi:hypothetical protein